MSPNLGPSPGTSQKKEPVHHHLHHRPHQPSHYEVLGLHPPSLGPLELVGSSPRLGYESDGGRREGGSTTRFSQSQVKKAYRQALLRWHPDKIISSNSGIGAFDVEWVDNNVGLLEQGEKIIRKKGDARHSGKGGGFTVDQIRNAYDTLSDDKRRREYEREFYLQFQQQPQQQSAEGSIFRDAEIVLWNRPCEKLDLDDFYFVEGKEGGGGGRFTRSCRCGEGEGYVITEEMLDGFAEEGVWEVQIECLGCSLAVVAEYGEGERRSGSSGL